MERGIPTKNVILPHGTLKSFDSANIVFIGRAGSWKFVSLPWLVGHKRGCVWVAVTRLGFRRLLNLPNWPN